MDMSGYTSQQLQLKLPMGLVLGEFQKSFGSCGGIVLLDEEDVAGC